MDNNNFDNKISDDINADLSLEAILAEFKTGKDSDLNESLESPRTAADLHDGFGRSIRETGFRELQKAEKTDYLQFRYLTRNLQCEGEKTK